MCPKSFLLLIEQDADWYVASADEFLVHGDGPSKEAAIRDYYECLGEYYWLVRESALAGDPFDQEELARLDAYISGAGS